jgi:drug/metabolite transporter (DMT)-like permease
VDKVDLESQKPVSAAAIGYMLFFLFVLVNSLADSVSKILYLSHSDLSVFEMLLMRGVIVLVLMLYLMRGRFKELMWDSIPLRMFLPLILRSFSGLFAFFCINYALKHLPLVLVALITNTLPLFTSLLGFLILGERITFVEVGCLLLAFYGVYLLVNSSYGEEQ